MNLLLKTTFNNVKEVKNLEDFLDSTKISFNISIAKLKKIFKMSYLIEILMKEDTFVENETNEKIVSS